MFTIILWKLVANHCISQKFGSPNHTNCQVPHEWRFINPVGEIHNVHLIKVDHSHLIILKFFWKLRFKSLVQRVKNGGNSITLWKNTALLLSNFPYFHLVNGSKSRYAWCKSQKCLFNIFFYNVKSIGKSNQHIWHFGITLKTTQNNLKNYSMHLNWMIFYFKKKNMKYNGYNSSLTISKMY